MYVACDKIIIPGLFRIKGGQLFLSVDSLYGHLMKYL